VQIQSVPFERLGGMISVTTPMTSTGVLSRLEAAKRSTKPEGTADILPVVTISRP